MNNQKHVYCPRCGTKIPQNSVFCPHCGFKYGKYKQKLFSSSKFQHSSNNTSSYNNDYSSKAERGAMDYIAKKKDKVSREKTEVTIFAIIMTIIVYIFTGIGIIGCIVSGAIFTVIGGAYMELTDKDYDKYDK